ncbi:MAG: hypothetical protein AMXMBFR33_55810 [Candidatus Xenobia bacterium]
MLLPIAYPDLQLLQGYLDPIELHQGTIEPQLGLALIPVHGSNPYLGPRTGAGPIFRVQLEDDGVTPGSRPPHRSVSKAAPGPPEVLLGPVDVLHGCSVAVFAFIIVAVIVTGDD